MEDKRSRLLRKGTMAHFFIELLKGVCADNNQDWNNADSVYSVTVLTTGSNFYTNVSKSQIPSVSKNKTYG